MQKHKKSFFFFPKKKSMVDAGLPKFGIRIARPYREREREREREMIKGKLFNA
jgi:hypothetical protein